MITVKLNNGLQINFTADVMLAAVCRNNTLSQLFGKQKQLTI